MTLSSSSMITCVLIYGVIGGLLVNGRPFTKSEDEWAGMNAHYESDHFFDQDHDFYRESLSPGRKNPGEMREDRKGLARTTTAIKDVVHPKNEQKGIRDLGVFSYDHHDFDWKSHSPGHKNPVEMREDRKSPAKTTTAIKGVVHPVNEQKGFRDLGVFSYDHHDFHRKSLSPGHKNPVETREDHKSPIKTTTAIKGVVHPENERKGIHDLGTFSFEDHDSDRKSLSPGHKNPVETREDRKSPTKTTTAIKGVVHPENERKGIHDLGTFSFEDHDSDRESLSTGHKNPVEMREDRKSHAKTTTTIKGDVHPRNDQKGHHDFGMFSFEDHDFDRESLSPRYKGPVEMREDRNVPAKTTTAIKGVVHPEDEYESLDDLFYDEDYSLEEGFAPPQQIHQYDPSYLKRDVDSSAIKSPGKSDVTGMESVDATSNLSTSEGKTRQVDALVVSSKDGGTSRTSSVRSASEHSLPVDEKTIKARIEGMNFPDMFISLLVNGTISFLKKTIVRVCS